MAVDFLRNNPDDYDKLPSWIKEEVYKVSHRAYCTGFFFNHPNEQLDTQYYENSGYIREYDVVAMVDECRDGRIYATQRNKFNRGDKLEILAPGKEPVKIIADKLYNDKNEEIETANHAMMKMSLECDKVFVKNSIIRMKK